MGANVDNYLWKSFLEAERNQGDISKSNVTKCPWVTDNFQDVTEFSEMLKFKKHAAHVMLWCPAKESDMMLEEYPLKYRIPMQLRFDGKFGFPGGLVDEMVGFIPADFDEFLKVIKTGLMREVHEEVLLKTDADPKYLYSCCSRDILPKSRNGNLDDGKTPYQGYVMHFFTCQVSLSAVETMEKSLLEILSNDEVLGLTRVPLYFMYDNLRGLPSFLTNSFIGNAFEQLLRACLAEGFLSERDVRFAIYAASTIMPKLKS